ncbi:hypothetical protein [Ruminococcus flavefaciens]|uniref:Uncharacterized protein n=1 Tax=Ruminococcus flavefaciens TaxID=1265 RepID=A0A315YRW5_RUMFL|nr:hypothetical protein [Ruminococcus flavefaciens]PWJ15117.1 hypothetical protein IE37_00006 [Ruminococcus flavefaciens]SSA39861.1 hypothetical protein SAMN02910325_00006 [Ruminococcus flavefaciens]
MGRTRTEPKIKTANFIYNSDKTAFDNFIEAMIHDYLNSLESAQTAQVDFSGKVEFSEDKEKIVDF